MVENQISQDHNRNDIEQYVKYRCAALLEVSFILLNPHVAQFPHSATQKQHKTVYSTWELINTLINIIYMCSTYFAICMYSLKHIVCQFILGSMGSWGFGSWSLLHFILSLSASPSTEISKSRVWLEIFFKRSFKRNSTEFSLLLSLLPFYELHVKIHTTLSIKPQLADV